MRVKNKNNKCATSGCSSEAYCKGLCKTHFNRIKMRKYRYGREHLVQRENGTGSVNKGYVLLSVDGKRKSEHIVIAEKALGKPLPKGAVVHHADRNTRNNSNQNLVVCPNQAYHLLLHKRMRDLGYA